MNPKTKQRLNGVTAKLTPLERQLKEFIRDEQDNLSIRELDYLIQAECSLSEAYAFIQQTK